MLSKHNFWSHAFVAVLLCLLAGLVMGDTKSYAIVLVYDLPPEARLTLAKIKTGGPFAYRQDGSVFGNREGFLPTRYRGYYTEYTVATPGSRDRGARRIIAGAGKERSPRLSGEYYYTDDHYQSFRRIIER